MLRWQGNFDKAEMWIISQKVENKRTQARAKFPKHRIILKGTIFCSKLLPYQHRDNAV